jgi:hypothetical protein
MKISKKSAAEVEKEYKESPPRQKGQWTEIVERVKDTNSAVEVTELSKGQVAAAARKFKESGLRFRAFYGEGRILVLPPEAKK